MPPFPAWFLGHDAVGRFLSERASLFEWRVRPITANGQLAAAFYQREPGRGPFPLTVVSVLSLREGRIAEMHSFLDPALHRWFGLPDELIDAVDALADPARSR